MTDIEKALKEVTGLDFMRFYRKARMGGYPPIDTFHGIEERLLLDPRAWNAVGEVEGWGIWKWNCNEPEPSKKSIFWGDKQRQFVDVLIRLSEEDE